MPDHRRIHQSLDEHKVDKSLTKKIMGGNGELPAKTTKKEKAAFISRIIDRMDRLMDLETRTGIIDWCACCKGGARDKAVKQFAKDNKDQSLTDRLAAIRNVPNMGRPKLNEDGTISTGIFWLEGDEYRCPCPCFRGLKLAEPVSLTYCYCCAGHFRHHYQNAFGLKLKTKAVVSSVINSLGRKPCQFVYEIVD